jgi:hypothetical protein
VRTNRTANRAAINVRAEAQDIVWSTNPAPTEIHQTIAAQTERPKYLKT